MKKENLTKEEIYNLQKKLYELFDYHCDNNNINISTEIFYLERIQEKDGINFIEDYLFEKYELKEDFEKLNLMWVNKETNKEGWYLQMYNEINSYINKEKQNKREILEKELKNKIEIIYSFCDFIDILDFIQDNKFNFNIIHKNSINSLFCYYEDKYDNQEEILFDFYNESGKIYFCTTSSMTINIFKNNS
jgi:hypothetical protein